MKRIMTPIFFFAVLLGCTTTKQTAVDTKKVGVDTIPMDEVYIPVSAELAADTLRIPGDTIKKGDGFVILDQGYISGVGITGESAGGAFVQIDSFPYFLKNLERWPSDVFHKKVKVSGRCIIYDGRVRMRSFPYLKGFRVKKTLEEAKWEVVE